MNGGVARSVVTGAFGFIGSALTARLVRAGPVVAVGRAARASLPPGDAEVLVGDVALVAQVLRPGDAIVHLAGGGGDARCRAEPLATARDIIGGTVTVASAARRAGAGRLLAASTIAVYGTAREHPGPYRESDEPLPDDLYGTYKFAAERVWVELGCGTALRLANVYGAGIGVDLGLDGVVERFARAAARGAELTVYGDGNQRIDLVHVEDVTRAIELALRAPSLPDVLNIGGGTTCTILEVAEVCADAAAKLGARPRIARRPAPAGKLWPTRSLDISRAASVLHWHPEVRLADGVRELVTMMHRRGAVRGSPESTRRPSP